MKLRTIVAAAFALCVPALAFATGQLQQFLANLPIGNQPTYYLDESGVGTGPFVPAVALIDSSGSPAASPFTASSVASITRPSNTTTYTANTAWNNATSSSSGTFSFTGICRANGGHVLIPNISIWSTANQTTALQGVLWLFSAVPAAIINDNATFTLGASTGNPPAGDFANLTGSKQGFAFKLANAQASGAANAGVTLSGTSYEAKCASGSTTITGEVEVVNFYVPLSGEVLSVSLHAIGLN